ncbi:hypothetical protein FMM68_08215 [Lachnospiraceae bacterium MD329]|nr:hypothetical protein [Lachnospiraceae bacterium MD329]
MHRKILCLALICALISPTAVFAENTDSVSTFDSYEQYDFSTFSNADNNIDSAVEYVIAEIAENQPDIIDISKFKIPYDPHSQTNEFISKFKNSILFEHPELFYLSAYFKYSYTYDGFLTDIIMNEPVDVIDSNGNIIQEMPYTMDKEEIARRQASIDKETNHILSLVDDNMTPLQEVLIVHDYIVANYTYDYSYNSSSLDSMIIDKTGVCQGYAYLFYHIMAQLDIPCINVPSEECRHIWNKVQLDGEWYNIDVTHDDPKQNNTLIDYSAGNKRTHFLVSDNELKSFSEKEDTDPLSCKYHYVWNNEDYCVANDDSYSDSILRSINSLTVYKDEKFYCFDSDNNLCTIDFEKNVLKPVCNTVADSKWLPYGQTASMYAASFSTPVLFDGDIYFNSPDKIYKFDTKTNKAEIFRTYDGKTDISNTYFYGLRVIDNKMYAEYSENPNNEPTLMMIAESTPYLPCSSEITDGTVQNGFFVTADIPEDIKDTTEVYVAQYDKHGIFIGFAVNAAETDGGQEQFVYGNNCKTIKILIWNKYLLSPLANVTKREFN